MADADPKSVLTVQMSLSDDPDERLAYSMGVRAAVLEMHEAMQEGCELEDGCGCTEGMREAFSNGYEEAMKLAVRITSRLAHHADPRNNRGGDDVAGMDSPVGMQ